MLKNRLATNNQTNIRDTTTATQVESAEVAPQITNSAEEQVQVTTFADDLGILAEPLPGETPLPALATMQHADARAHSIISFLGRPQVLRTFEFKAQNRGDILASIRVPDDLLNATSGMYKDKLDGFTSFRATAVIKLQINSEPFQCGRLLMYSMPMPTLTGERGKWIDRHVSMAQALHNIQLDIAKQTEVELRIPFVSPFNSYDLIQGLYPWSDLKIMVYAKLESIGVTSLQCLLWGHFEDVVLGAPTSGKILSNVQQLPVQQSGRMQPRSGQSAPLKPAASQVNAVREKEATGFISKISQGAQGFYNGIGNTIPALKPVTDVFSGLSKATASGLGGIASGLFSLLGFSKPVLSHAGATVLARPTQFFANINGNDHSHVLSLDVLNAIDEYPALGGTLISETSLEYLKKIPQYITNFCYAKESTYNTPLATWFVSPMYVIPMDCKLDQYGTSKANIRQPTVLNYISSVFEYWSGSLVYTIRFVKTDYHSGRVEVSFHPFVYGKVDDTRMDYVYRLVVDLRDNSEVSFVVPYVSPQPWKKIKDCYNNSNGSDVPPLPLVFGKDVPDNKQNEYAPFTTGVVHVRALTPLVCASAIIAPSIECLVEVRGGDDFRLQCPDRNLYLPFTFFTAPGSQLPKQQSGVVAVPGTQETRTSSIEGFLPPSITGDDADIHTDDTQRFCAGEVFDNYLSLTRRFSYCEKVDVLKDNVLYRDAMYYVRPPVMTSVQQGPADNKVAQLKFQTTPTPLNFVSSMYAFYRGGYRIKTYNPNTNLDITAVQLFSSAIRDYLSAGITTFNFMGASAYEQVVTKRFAEFQVPYYSPTLMTAFWPFRLQGGDGSQYSQPTIKLAISGTNMKAEPLHLASAAADDFSLHTFIGIPPIIPNSLVQRLANATSSFFYVNNSSLSVNPTLPLDMENNDHTSTSGDIFQSTRLLTTDTTGVCWTPPKQVEAIQV